jgi:uncharacterized protein (TIGR02996 family)
VSRRVDHADAVAAFRAGKRRRLLEVLVEAWRGVRAVEIAEVIDQVSREVVVGPIPGKTREERGALWSALERQRRVEDVPRLVAGVVDCLRKDAEERVRRIAQWAIDPRASAILVRLIESPPNGYRGWNAQRFWRAVVDWIADIKDLRALGELEALATAYREARGSMINEYLPAMLDSAIAQIKRAESAAIDQEWRAVLDAIRAPAADRSAERLIAQVYREPDDLELRAVLGDLLQAQGDPRGEFIALQLSERTTRGKKRERELVREHGRAWLGGIEPVIHKAGVLFEGGFLAKARAGIRDSRRSEAAVGRPEWATVHTLDVEPWEHESVASLVGHENMRSLRDLRGARASVFAIARTMIIESLGLRFSSPEIVPAIVECQSLPKLRRLDLGSSWIEPHQLEIWASAIGSKLEELAIRAIHTPIDWILTAQTIDAPALETLRVNASRHNPWGVVISRDPQRRFTHLTFFFGWPHRTSNAEDDLRPILDALPPGYSTAISPR